MKDIQLKKTTSSTFSDLALEPAPAAVVSTRPAASLWIEKTIDHIGTAANSLYRLTSAPAKEKAARAKGARRADRGKALTTAARSAGTKARKHAGAALKKTRNPIAGLAILQVAAVAGLVFYVSHRTQPAPDQTVSGTTAQAAGLQRHLPSVGKYVEPKPYAVPTPQSAAAVSTFNTWVTPWNMASVQSTLSSYGSFSAFWLTVGSDGFTMTPKADWSTWDSFAATKKPGASYYLTVTGDPDDTYLALSDPDIQSKHIAALLQTVEAHNFDGVDIDYEGLGSENSDLFTAFVRNLTTAFHAQNKTVAVTVEARINNAVPMDWQALGSIADELRIMVYDYHSQTTSEPGAIAPIGWLKEVLDYAAQKTDIHKVVVGLGNYGYDWVSSVQDGTTTWSGTGISFEQADAIAKDRAIPIVRATGIDDRGYDIGSVPTFTYQDSDGNQHSVWFEDSASLQSKVTLAQQYPIKGLIFWSVGLGDQGFWTDHTSGN